MTPTTETACTAKTAPAAKAVTPMSREEVRKMLRDAAFVLHMTRRVKAEILASRPEATKSTVTNSPETPAGLGV
jgi:hypothetical protein